MSSTIPYRPSNGSEGAAFEESFCGRCEYERGLDGDDRINGCSILTRALALGRKDPGFPSEWISDADGGNPRCTRFRMVGTGTHAEAAADRARYDQAMAEMKASQR